MLLWRSGTGKNYALWRRLFFKQKMDREARTMISGCATTKIPMRLVVFFFSFFSFVLLLYWEALRKDRDLVILMAFGFAGLRVEPEAVLVIILLSSCV